MKVNDIFYVKEIQILDIVYNWVIVSLFMF